MTQTTHLGAWRIAYETRGESGIPLVFVHGWASDHRFWRPQLDADWPEMRLVAVDLIGHGASAAPPERYTMSLLARSVLAVLDAESIDRAVIVGHSAGVAVARQVYRLAPERVLALALIDGFLRKVPWSPWQEQMLVQMKGDGYDAVIERFATGMPPGRAPEADVALVTSALRATPKHVAISTLEEAQDPAIWQNDRIERPLLVLRATSPFAPIAPAQLATEAQALAPNAETHVWEDASHVLTMEYPERFNALLRSFVRRTAVV